MAKSNPLKISTADARVDMILAQPIIDKQGRVIMTEGSHLTAVHLKRFDRWGVSEIVIAQEDKTEDPGEVAAAEVNTKPTEDAQTVRIDEGYMRSMAPVFNQRFESVSDKPIMAALKKIAFKCVVLAGRGGIPGVRENSTRGH